MYLLLKYSGKATGEDRETIIRPKAVNKEFSSLDELDKYTETIRRDIMRQHPDCVVEIFPEYKNLTPGEHNYDKVPIRK